MAKSKMKATRNSENVKTHFKGHEEFVSRIMDFERQAIHSQRTVFSPFYRGDYLTMAKAIVKDAYVYEDGGYAEAQSKRLAFSAYPLEEVDFPIVCLHAGYDARHHELSHRDVLGALMALGIERSILGDILVEEGELYFFCAKEMEVFLIEHLTQVKRSPITLEKYEGPVKRNDHLLITHSTIPSPRLDAIVALLAHTSREKAKSLLKQGKVEVNQIILEDCSFLCHNKCTVSIRGIGRFEIEIADQKTKKGRIPIQVGKYQ